MKKLAKKVDRSTLSCRRVGTIVKFVLVSVDSIWIEEIPHTKLCASIIISSPLLSYISQLDIDEALGF